MSRNILKFPTKAISPCVLTQSEVIHLSITKALEDLLQSKQTLLQFNDIDSSDECCKMSHLHSTAITTDATDSPPNDTFLDVFLTQNDEPGSIWTTDIYLPSKQASTLRITPNIDDIDSQSLLISGQYSLHKNNDNRLFLALVDYGKIFDFLDKNLNQYQPRVMDLDESYSQFKYHKIPVADVIFSGVPVTTLEMKQETP